MEQTRFAHMDDWKAVDLLPRDVEGREATAPPRLFGPSDLHLYTNGGAAIYLAYDFRELAVASYPIGRGEDAVVIEVYRMGSGHDAFGVYSDGAEGEHPDIGQDAAYGAGLLRFWKGRAFLRIFCLSEQNERRRRILALGREIAARIPETGERPRLMRVLPPEGLVADRATYFHTTISLNHLYFLSDGNPLGLGPHTDAVFAEYEIGEHAPKLLLVRYPGPDEAAGALAQFEGVYLPDRPACGAAQDTTVRVEVLEDGQAVGLLRTDALLILCLDAGRSTAQSLPQKVARLFHREFATETREEAIDE
jgi:hypothetical protein